ncbi:MAG: hypothetical protein QOG47_2251, partial [Mycobacterium sp.]|nr:hypothetical protein [Mycobacterium sp.]
SGGMVFPRRWRQCRVRSTKRRSRSGAYSRHHVTPSVDKAFCGSRQADSVPRARRDRENKSPLTSINAVPCGWSLNLVKRLLRLLLTYNGGRHFSECQVTDLKVIIGVNCVSAQRLRRRSAEHTRRRQRPRRRARCVPVQRFHRLRDPASPRPTAHRWWARTPPTSNASPPTTRRHCARHGLDRSHRARPARDGRRYDRRREGRADTTGPH